MNIILCESGSNCAGGAEARYVVQYERESVKRICTECFHKDQIKIENKIPMLDCLGTSGKNYIPYWLV